MARFLTPFVTRAPMARDPFTDLHREMNRLFDDAFRGMGTLPSTGGGASSMMAAPRIDAHEADGNIEITAELPGVNPNDVEVRLDDDLLTIRGEKRSERRNEQAHVSERSYGSFQRSIQLPFAPDPGRVQANFENGVLKITLPKQGPQQRSHRIEVRGGQGGGGSVIEGSATPAGGEQGGAGQASGASAAGQGGSGVGAQAGEASDRMGASAGDLGSETTRSGASTAPEAGDEGTGPRSAGAGV